MKKIFSLIVLVAIAASAFAVGFENERGNALNARYAHVQCWQVRADALVNSYESCSGESDALLQSLKAQLASDMQILDSAANRAEAGNFHVVITGAINNDLVNIVNRIIALRQTERGKDSQVRACFRDAFKQSRDEFSSCTDSAVVTEGQAAVAWFRKWNDHWNEVITNMSNDNMSVSGMQIVASDAQSLLHSAQSAVDTGDPDTIRQEARNTGTLYLHLWARFSIARINSYLDALEPYAQQYGMMDRVTEIRNELASASALAQANRPYSQGEWETTWNTINDAAVKTNILKQDITQQRIMDTS